MELSTIFRDPQGTAFATRKRNKLREVDDLRSRSSTSPVVELVVADVTTDTGAPLKALSKAEKKHREALAKHGVGSRQEARARRQMAEFEYLFV